MFNNKKFIKILLFSCFSFSLSLEKITIQDKIEQVKVPSEQNDFRVHELHQYILKNKNIFNDHLVLMSHSDYTTILKNVIEQMDQIISYNAHQPVINKDLLNNIGINFNEIHFIDYNQLKIIIKNQLIKNKIKSIISKNK